MINSFNLAPVSEVPPPFCAEGVPTPLEDCTCSPRQRSAVTSYKIPRSGTIKVTSGETYQRVFCPNESTRSWGGKHPTAADVQVRPYILAGDVFIKIIHGRVGRVLTLVLTTVNELNNIGSLSITLEIVE